jgi:hypothetical protein
MAKVGLGIRVCCRPSVIIISLIDNESNEAVLPMYSRRRGGCLPKELRISSHGKTNANLATDLVNIHNEVSRWSNDIQLHSGNCQDSAQPWQIWMVEEMVDIACGSVLSTSTNMECSFPAPGLDGGMNNRTASSAIKSRYFFVFSRSESVVSVRRECLD